MSFLELARKRCSIRKYAPKNVEQEKIDYILEAARLAPSAVNYQREKRFPFDRCVLVKQRKEMLSFFHWTFCSSQCTDL